ncbi:TetR/AcrR family transcriptional regulator [Paenibacillus sp. FSL F4-0087]|jgi:TetR/AcrR family transcriptional repressor of nem operon|uniref:TetR/AcrR family transcriptional regulator n=1 Tax=Paenibacillus taichungensis TaxID=484184 RepID=A0ABX2MQG3_9BACL|nr:MULTISPECIES: TetR/AcrR family transcriptional regulator [Paenibacillus]MDR9745433.1 TetR/AcrR family transcriptional regulator [Paenibacillus taichungensis]NEU59534.1 TetR/AcrR family transcriptional regulator [Paenibacillus sp. ALJ109b]NUU56321.1 TetR/AcrR family transcriptional regulator [Paenibacillus taichungensis]OME78824.1 TetR family transcriptional regulator [Paenibacillus pabuli]
MVRQREFDTDQALEAAMQIFWDKGFEATSLSDLTTAMGIQRPSLYAAFGDKKELFETALRRYTTLHAAQVRSRLQHTSSVKEAFRALFEHIGAEGDVTDARHGCFCINTMVELAPHDPKFAVLTREHQMYLVAIFKETIERGQETGELSNDLDSSALSKSLVVSMIGLTVMMKSEPDRSFVQQSIKVTLSLLEE